MLVEQIRIPPGSGEAVQPFAMFSVKQVDRYQHALKESQTRGHSIRIVPQVDAQKKVCINVRIGPCSAKTDHSTGHTLVARARYPELWIHNKSLH